jgi:hypothetical protein
MNQKQQKKPKVVMLTTNQSTQQIYHSVQMILFYEREVLLTTKSF